jgi:hypothetical protein
MRTFMRNPILTTALATWLMLCSAACSAAEIRETFESGDPDRVRWSLLLGGNLKFDGKTGWMRLSLEPGPAERGPVGLGSKFRLAGDFEASCDFEIRELAPPKEHWINIEIFVEGVDGAASVLRHTHSTDGDGYAAWSHSPVENRPGAWERKKTTDRRGTLKLQRVGEKLLFQYVGADGNVETLEEYAFGTGPIDSIQYRVLCPSTTETRTEVGMGNLVVRADEIIEPPLPATSSVGDYGWARLIGVGSVLLLVLAGFLAWRKYH